MQFRQRFPEAIEAAQANDVLLFAIRYTESRNGVLTAFRFPRWDDDVKRFFNQQNELDFKDEDVGDLLKEPRTDRFAQPTRR